MEKIVPNILRVKATIVDYLVGFMLPSIFVQVAFLIAYKDHFNTSTIELLASFPIALVMFIYWVLVPYWFGGKTLGKKLFGIKIVSLNEDGLKISQLIKRLLFAYQTLFIWLTLQGHGRDDNGLLPHDRRSNTGVVFLKEL